MARCQEEGEFHLSLLSILRHIGIKVIGRIVKGTRPLRFHADCVSLAVGQHGTRQYNMVRIR